MTGSTTPGRPRDPDVDRRVHEAAVAVFGEVGWAAFSIDAVARRAGVGKASIYLRWPGKDALLAEALRARFAWIADVDTGTVRGDLLELARQLLHLYLGDTGRAALRISLDGPAVDWLSGSYEQVQQAPVLAVRAIARRAVNRGELPAQTPVTLLLDALCGGVIGHALATPERLRPQVLANADAYAEQLVDFLLRAVTATGAPDSSPRR